jgi:ATP-dependent DNA helicase DinG
VLVLCDPRLRSRSYGKIFLDSLPPMPRTTSLADVRTFFASAAGPGHRGLASAAGLDRQPGS